MIRPCRRAIQSLDTTVMSTTTMMSTTANTPHQPLPLRRRPELQSQEITYRRRSYWSVKDPLSLRYFQLRDEEHFILSSLDGETSLSTLQHRFHAAFAPRRVDLAQLSWFLGMLHREGLIMADAADQGLTLLDRRRRSLRRQFWARFSSILAIRFRGIDPTPLVNTIYPLVRWVYTPYCLAAMLGLLLVAMAVLVLEFPLVMDRLPAFGEFFHTDNLVWLAVAMGSAKVLHEFAHALTCRHFGGQCRELGVMLLVFTPCLYCNVSDAWMIPNKWRRIAVSAAGMIAELVLASACLLLWWSSEPGVFNAICLNLVFVCSVGTLLFNGNPLLRYDGYFVFSDWCELPNLAQRGSQYVRDQLWSLCTGVRRNTVPPAHSERLLLVVYTIAAAVYRIAIVAFILWVCYRALMPYGLQAVAVSLAFITFGGLIAMPVAEALGVMRDPSLRRQLRWWRVALTSVCLAVAGTLLLTTPFRLSVSAPVVLEPNDAQSVYVTAPGRLVEAKELGRRVIRGEVIARLKNFELEREAARLAADVGVQKRHVESLKRRRSRDSSGDVLGASGQLPAAMQALADLEERLQARRAEQSHLILRAPRTGMLMPSRQRVEDRTVAGQPAGWSGTPLDASNLGCLLEPGTELCLVGDPRQQQAQVIVAESQIALVRKGQHVRLYIDERSGGVLSGTVVEVAARDTDEAYPELVAKRLVPIKAEPGQPPHLKQTSYQVRIALDPYEAAIPLRASGRAVIRVAPRTLARRAYDFLCRTFRLELE